MLPFETFGGEEPLVLGDIQIPRYGCLTVQEAIAFEQVISSGQPLMEAGGGAIATLHFQPILVGLLLISRHSPAWTLERVQRELTANQIREGCDFLLGERRRWRDLEELPKPQEGSQTAKSTDWAEIFWKLQLHYPNEPRFSAAAFGNCPLLAVEAALGAIEQRQLEQANLAAIPIGLLGCYLLSAQGAKDMLPEHFNPYARLLNQQQAKDEVDPEVAKTFLELLAAGQVPGWVTPIANLGKLRLAAK